MAKCAKCGAEDPAIDWADDLNGLHECLYVDCDSADCRALKDPRTLEEWRDAANHWKTHRYMHGCSHGG
jgi:hypothetical protein